MERRASVSSLKFLFGYFFIFLVAVVVSLRGDTRDTINYIYAYINSDVIYWPSEYYSKFGFEWGFNIVAFCLNFIGVNYEIFFFLISTLTFLSIYRSAKYYGVSFLSVLFCYLPSFFILQQFMQIRQGLATALVFYGISAHASINGIKLAIIFILAISFHYTSVAPILLFLAIYFGGFIGAAELSRFRMLLVFSGVYCVCILFMRFDALITTDRISSYLDSDEFSSARAIFDLANIKPFLIMIFCLYALRKTKNTAIISTMYIYVAGVAARLSLLDVSILSGRIGSALSFGEIFLIPAAFFCLFKRRIAFLCIFLYFTITAYITFNFQVPFLIDDYFSPIIL